MLFLSFSTSGLNEWCGDTWVTWWNQPLSNTRTRCPCNRVPKQSSGVLHGLDKCLGLMTPRQPCLQKLQGHDYSPQRASTSSKASGGKFGWLLYIIQPLFWQKCWRLFVSVLAKITGFVCLPHFTNRDNQPTKEKKNPKEAVCLQSYWWQQRSELYCVTCACCINYFVFVGISVFTP